MAAALAISSCTGAEPTPREDLPFDPEYLATDVTVLDRELVQIDVAMRGARDTRDLTDFANCVMAGYADVRGFGFARHLRTQVDEEGGLWRADAVYTMSAGVPEGRRTIDVEAQINACATKGIPQLVRSNG